MNTDISNSDKKSSIEDSIGILLKKNNLTLSTAESCTGGGIASRITSIPGSSEYFKGGIVAYSNESKHKFLKVKNETLEKYGAVSEETILEMVKGSMDAFNTDCAIATSGIAGPGGGSLQKPIGTIWIAVALGEKIRSYRQEGDAGRKSNTERAITNALLLLQSMLDEENASHSQIINKLLV